MGKVEELKLENIVICKYKWLLEYAPVIATSTEIIKALKERYVSILVVNIRKWAKNINRMQRG